MIDGHSRIETRMNKESIKFVSFRNQNSEIVHEPGNADRVAQEIIWIFRDELNTTRENVRDYT
jgi:hypothetical protein